MNTPLSNTGVNQPGRMTRDERLVLDGGQVKVLCAERQQASQFGVVVDYLRITVKRDAVLILNGVKPGADDDQLTQFLAFRVAGLIGFELGDARNGRDFYAHTWTIVNGFGKEVASVSGGGENQRETFCVTIKGEGCTFGAKGWEARLHEAFAPLDPRVTRIDLARDYLAGEVTIEEVEHCFFTGAFDYRGRRPTYTRHGSGDSWDRTVGHSRTFQVGQRESGKLMRAYEKGHSYKRMTDAWLRLEVELRNVNRIVPFDALIRPADFFAGAYDFCQMVLDQKPVPERVPTGKAVGERTVERFARNFENQSAPSLKVMVQTLGPDDALELLARMVAKHSNRPMPRGLSGISHAKCEEGFRAWFNRYSEPVPAGSAPF